MTRLTTPLINRFAVPGSLLLLLGACGSPPKPPTVDESLRRPANAQIAVELQVCKNDLQNTRILATESGRLADTAAATLAHLAARQQLLASLQQRAMANSVHTVRFAFNSTRVDIPPDAAPSLLEDAKTAPLVLLRGRTDGASDSPAESRMAQARASAVRDYLIASGVDASRIRTTHQPSGDHVADNRSPQGRELNRRVEIEVYRALPVAQQAPPPPQP
jgi:outer membrane protein OmpA-like peptidoglycan-associated protein